MINNHFNYEQSRGFCIIQLNNMLWKRRSSLLGGTLEFMEANNSGGSIKPDKSLKGKEKSEKCLRSAKLERLQV